MAFHLIFIACYVFISVPIADSAFEKNTMPANDIDKNAVAHLAGFGNLTQIESSVRRKFDASGLPFLGRALIGSSIVEMVYAPMRLQFPSMKGEIKDSFERKFKATFDPVGRHLLLVTCRFAGKDPDMLPEPPAEKAEIQLQEQGEKYTAFPELQPNITFMQALDIIRLRGMSTPLFAKEIDGVYVMHSHNGGEERPVWVITFRGLPPRPARGPRPELSPPSARNHMRHVIDAMTGKIVFATTIPNP